MQQWRPLNIRHTMWLSITLTVASTVLGASALYRYQLYRSVLYSECLRAQAITETYAAQIAPLVATGQRSELISSIEELPWHQAICLIAVLNTSNNPIVVRGNDILLQKYLNDLSSDVEDIDAQTWNIPSDPERSMPEFNLAAVAIRVPGATESVGTLVCAARPSGEMGVTPQQVWNYFAKLVIIAAVCMMVGFLLLQQNVLKPLAMLSHGSKGVSKFASTRSLLTNRQDEIGELARVLTDMDFDIDEWGQRVSKLERSVIDRVAAETQKITRELRIAQKKIWTDPLTRLGNRRLFDDKFSEIFHAQSKANRDLSIVMIDVDYFKTLNDTLGHKVGDKLLVFVGELLSQGLREQDLAIRYGGDEFLLILPSVSVQTAQAIAERTVRMFAQQAKMLHVEPTPTMSAGIVSLFDHQPDSPESMVQLADQALYDAKDAGKSCVLIYKTSQHVTSNL